MRPVLSAGVVASAITDLIDKETQKPRDRRAATVMTWFTESDSGEECVTCEAKVRFGFTVKWNRTDRIDDNLRPVMDLARKQIEKFMKRIADIEEIIG